MGKRIIISGGGTGGHIYPAIAIAKAIQEIAPSTEILFVGAKGKMEMEKVPKAGYPIKGLWISGLQRKITFKNLLFPLKVIVSLFKARQIIRSFKPDAAVGVGGYASGPLLKVAGQKGIPSLVQEQNSYAGMTNKWLAKNATKICVAYDHMDRFFPKEKIIMTGNPVRKDILNLEGKREEAYAHFGLDPNKKTLVILGGSLGARTLNESMIANLKKINGEEVQVLWQAGKLYIEEFEPQVKGLGHIKISAFVYRMDLAYALADVLLCRAGALTISELCLVGKAAILIPSPNVAEDHQTANAKALVDVGAAILVKDVDARKELIDQALLLLEDKDQQQKLGSAILKLGRPDASKTIAMEVLNMIKV